MKTKSFLFIFLTTYILLASEIIAQCSGGTASGALSPTPSGSYQTMAVTAGRYYTIITPTNPCPPVYYFSFCSADGGSSSADTQITILDNSGTYAGGYNDDNCGAQSYLVWTPTSTVSATYRILINNYPCGASGTGTLAYKMVNTYTNTAEFTLLGSATNSGGCNIVTPNTSGQTGCSWDINSTLNFASSFTYTFSVNLGASDGGADGMAFVIQNDPRGRCACGSTGGSLASGGITNSLILEIDTYLNTEDRDDFTSPYIGCSGTEDPDHLDLWLNGNVNPNLDSDCNTTSAGERPVTASAVRLQNPPGTNYNIENGLNHVLRVSWTTGSPGTFNAMILNTAMTTTYGVISTTLNPVSTFGTNTPYFGFTASTGGLSNQQSFCFPQILLPVELLDFKAHCAETGILLNWETASESNNKEFTILRSEDGINYSRIGLVNGSGNSNSLMAYHYVDTDADGDKLYYYKLMQTDFSNRSELYDMIASTDASCDRTLQNIDIFPNPATESINLHFKKTKVSRVEIYNDAGQQLNAYDEPGDQLVIQVSSLSNGIYLVKLNTGKGSIVRKFSVSR